jgi:hypothetical protein
MIRSSRPKFVPIILGIRQRDLFVVPTGQVVADGKAARFCSGNDREVQCSIEDLMYRKSSSHFVDMEPDIIRAWAAGKKSFARALELR